MINKIAVTTCLTMTLNVNGLNVSIKRQTDEEEVAVEYYSAIKNV